jgi:hypothetical protein
MKVEPIFPGRGWAARTDAENRFDPLRDKSGSTPRRGQDCVDPPPSTSGDDRSTPSGV